MLEVVVVSKLSNAIVLLKILQNGKKYSVKELAEMIEVSPRMIREYKNELELAGIFIESDRGPYGGYYLEQDVKLPEEVVWYKDIPVNNRKYYNLLVKAVNNRNKCYIEYYSKECDSITKRIIRPYKLIILDNEWGIVAFCEKKQEIRCFYLNRIRKMEVLCEKY